MSPLEIISRMCDVTNTLSDIVKKQQEIIEQSKIEEAVKADLRQQVKEADRELDVIEYHSRRFCDTDDIEATFGKETAVDDWDCTVAVNYLRRVRRVLCGVLKNEE